MAITGTVRSFEKKFRFNLRIDGFGSMSFHKLSKLKVKVNVTKHREGGAMLPNKSPGLADFDPLTAERGATQDFDMFLWFKTVLNAAADAGLKDPFYKRHMDVLQRERDGEIIKTWTIFNAWPTEFGAGEWDNTSDENVIEDLVIEYDYFERTR